MCLLCLQGVVGGVTGIVTKPVEGRSSKHAPLHFYQIHFTSNSWTIRVQERRRRAPLASSKASVKAWWEWLLAPLEESWTWRAAHSRASRGKTFTLISPSVALLWCVGLVLWLLLWQDRELLTLVPTSGMSNTALVWWLS